MQDRELRLHHKESNTILECNSNLLLSYGLSGYSRSVTTQHKYCPLIH